MLETFSSLSHVCLSLLLALFAGMVIGIERELAHKPAGLRTQSLIALGTTMFVISARQFDVEPARVIANVVTGLGFLGAGVILQQKGVVRGMTTSALIWVNGSIGLAIGLGQYAIAVFGLFLAITALRLLGIFEKMMKTKCSIAHYSITTNGSNEATQIVRNALKSSHHDVAGLSFYRDGEKLTLKFGFCNRPSRHREFVEELQTISGVLAVESQA